MYFNATSQLLSVKMLAMPSPLFFGIMLWRLTVCNYVYILTIAIVTELPAMIVSRGEFFVIHEQQIHGLQLRQFFN